MTLMSSISKLTTSVDQLADEANVPKATLDANVAHAAAEVVSAQAEQALTEEYRDTAATHAANGATHLATVKAGVTYKGISAILAEKVVTAVDVFVYDTSLDSDGGAWRRRCQHTSWYNEPLNTATRGARREFPAVTIIVVELPNKVTIFDADDPDLPMWMIANTRGEQNIAPFAITALGGQANYLGKVFAQNGQICICGTGGYSSQALLRWDFPADRFGNQAPNSSYSGWTAGSLSERNNLKEFVEDLPLILAPQVNDVAMTVFPDAPVDPATGLPLPTIAVATSSGISVIQNDGTVVNKAGGAYFAAEAHGDFYIAQAVGDAMSIFAWDHLGTQIDYTRGDRRYNGNQLTGLWPFLGGNGGNVTSLNSKNFAYGPRAPANSGFSLYSEDLSNPRKSLQARIFSSFSSGWLPGDIKGAWLASASSDPLSDATLITGDNSSFSTGIGNWQPRTTAVISHDADRLKIELNAQLDGATLYLNSLKVGETYTLSADAIAGTYTGNMRLQISGIGVPAEQLATATAIMSEGGTALVYQFVATSSTHIVEFMAYSAASEGQTVFLDSVRLSVGDPDRSIKRRGLIVNGTIARNPVAADAELMGYSGFSAANHLEQPYNSALDFGTGDFCVMGWVKPTATNVQNILSITDKAGTAFGSNGYITLRYSSGWGWACSGGSISSAFAASLDWQHLCLLRRNGVLNLYVDGVLAGIAANVGNLGATNSASVLIFGLGYYNSGPSGGFGGGLALWRISATAPTTHQIVKIYEDERKLFRPGAQCTLYGPSDAVTALAHDPKTNLLHVGTSAGRSTFDGLQRVANTETPVGTAISAVNGLIAEQ